MEYLDMVLDNWLTVFPVVVTIANAITMVTPSTADNVVVKVALKLLNVTALNVIKNKNADDR